MPFTQDNRFIAIDTPLGKDVLLLMGFTGTEDISELFSFELDLLSENHNITFKDIIGKNVTISVKLADGSKRFFNGIISRFSQGRGGGKTGPDARFSYYSATMVPWFWLLTRTADSRIFQRLSVPDIVEQIFNEKSFLDFKVNLSGSYDKWDYCVQYRETDFNFVSRLMEEEGISYFFEHEQGKHTLVLSDVPDEHKPCPNQESARYQISAGGWMEKDTINSLEIMQEIMPGKYTLNDYNFETPTTDLKAEVPSQQDLGPGEREIYDYPGGYSKKADGERLTNVRMQEEEAQITIITGSSNCRAFTSGYRFKLENYFRTDMNEKEFVLTSVDHQARQEFSSGEKETELAYGNSFTCIPFEVPFRPQRNTPKPVVEGVQTAIVVGPAGEEIYPDKHARVKVQFHWDREGKNDEESSCWIRVSQLWAGAGWGAMYIPRIGHEVIVDFEEGDPDRPIITGRVYHGNNRPPYDLPGEKTKSTIKSESSLGGGGFNEIRFEDKKDNEEVYIHSQKDTLIRTEHDKNQSTGHDETLLIGHDRQKTVDNDETTNIGNNRTENVGKNESITIGENRTESVGKNEDITIGENRSESVGKNEEINIGKNRTEAVGKDETISIGGDRSISVDKNNTIAVTKDYTLTAKKILIKADDQITLKTGSAMIVMKKSGDIQIKGKKIMIKGSGDVIIKGSKIKEN